MIRPLTAGVGQGPTSNWDSSGTPLNPDQIASILADAASRGVPLVRELFRLAAIGGLHEEQLPKPLPRRDGSLERAG